MTTFTYVSNDTQIVYSPGRSALGEYVKSGRPSGQWMFMGWLYEGEVHSHEDAKRLTAEYLTALGVGVPKAGA